MRTDIKRPDEKKYQEIHYWIRKNYGKATICEKDNSHKSSRYEWANISGEYRRDISDYMQLCPACHKKMDSERTICKHGHEMTEENTYIDPRGFRTCRKCRNRASARYKKEKEIAHAVN